MPDSPKKEAKPEKVESTELGIYISTVLRLLDTARPLGHVPPHVDYELDTLREFLDATGKSHPSDVLPVLEAAAMVANATYRFPSREEINILEACWNAAWGWSGSLQWKYSRSMLTLQYSPKKTGAFYQVDFQNQHGDGMPYFPLTVRFQAWADMDEESSHADECPMYNPWLVERERHYEGCPWRTASQEATNEELDAASEACECSFECHCEPDIVTDVRRTFTIEDLISRDLQQLLTQWLHSLIHEGGV